jgi:hypothetical protein
LAEETRKINLSAKENWQTLPNIFVSSNHATLGYQTHNLSTIFWDFIIILLFQSWLTRIVEVVQKNVEKKNKLSLSVFAFLQHYFSSLKISIIRLFSASILCNFSNARIISTMFPFIMMVFFCSQLKFLITRCQETFFINDFKSCKDCSCDTDKSCF